MKKNITKDELLKNYMYLLHKLSNHFLTEKHKIKRKCLYIEEYDKILKNLPHKIR